jgi:hypothetical protein
MPALDNPKHERFAQELAKGLAADKAYELAGFKPNRGNAATLKQKQSISDRVLELLSEREAIHAQATADAIKSTALTKEWVIQTLMENVARSMQAIEVKRPMARRRANISIRAASRTGLLNCSARNLACSSTAPKTRM